MKKCKIIGVQLLLPLLIMLVGNSHAQRLTGPRFKNTPTHKLKSQPTGLIAGDKLSYKGPSAKTPIHERKTDKDTLAVDTRREEVLKGPKAKNRKHRK